MPITRDAILSAGSVLPFEDVPADEIATGEKIRVRCLTAAESQKYQMGFWRFGPNGPTPTYSADDAFARLLVLSACAVNEDGSSGAPLFTDADKAALEGLNATLAMRLFEAAQRVSGLNHSIEEVKTLFAAAR